MGVQKEGGMDLNIACTMMMSLCIDITPNMYAALGCRQQKLYSCYTHTQVMSASQSVAVVHSRVTGSWRLKAHLFQCPPTEVAQTSDAGVGDGGPKRLSRRHFIKVSESYVSTGQGQVWQSRVKLGGLRVGKSRGGS